MKNSPDKMVLPPPEKLPEQPLFDQVGDSFPTFQTTECTHHLGTSSIYGMIVCAVLLLVGSLFKKHP